MRMSGFFLPVMRDVPKDAEIDSHKLMLRAGYIRQAAAGIYSWLPLGQMVLENIKTIINEEQAAAGAVELLMPTLQPADLWKKSGRYDDYGKEMLRFKDRHDRDLLYGPTNEELITQLVGENLQSYKELPLTLYHIQWKFRDEIRPRFGVMRGREFLMKDGYSFDLDEQSGVNSYHKMFAAYLRTFARLGLKSIPMQADTGPIGGSLSHEFIVLAQTGESEVFCHKSYLDRDTPNAISTYSKEELAGVVSDWTKDYAATEDMHNGEIFDRQVSKTDQLSARGIEVGHIFFFGDKYSKPMKCQVQGPVGQRIALQSGSYGIGVSRLAGAIIESSHDDKGIVWPTSVAPFKVGLINIKTGDEDCDTHCAKLYEQLHNAGISCLYDDRNERAGSKFATMDLVGLPWQIAIGPRGVKNGEAEITKRATGEKQSLPFDGVVEFIKAQCEK